MGNFQLEHNLEKLMMNTGTKWQIILWLGKKLPFHFNISTLCFAQDMRKMELTVHTHMLSLLPQSPRDKDPMALPSLPLHHKKGLSTRSDVSSEFH